MLLCFAAVREGPGTSEIPMDAQLNRVPQRIRFIPFVLACFLLPGVVVDAGDSIDHPIMMLSATWEDVSQVNEAGRAIDASTWVREIFRQHFLMIAREEFGFRTRDATLGEPVDRESADCFHLKVLPWTRAQVELTLTHDDRVIYEGNIPNKESDSLKKYRALAQHALNSRDSIVAAMKEAGYAPSSLPEDGLEVLPPEVESLLSRINPISQYAAVRRLHQLLHKYGESPAILSGLTRGYAHLSQMSLPLLDLRHRAYGARSLLYGHRLTRLTGDSAEGYWHRAYTNAFLGYPVGVETALKAAGFRKADETEEPPWLRLLRLSTRYEFAELQRFAEDEEFKYREIAALLWFMSSRMSLSSAFTIETGVKVRTIIPYSQCVIAGLFDSAGVPMNHRLSVQGGPVQLLAIYDHLADVADLPDSVSGDLQLKDSNDPDQTNPDEVLQQLVASQSPADVATLLEEAGELDKHEPSFHVLGSTFRAWNLQHVCQRAYFLKSYLGMDADDFVNETQDLVKASEYSALYAAVGVSSHSPAELASETTESIPHQELNFCSVGFGMLRALPFTARTQHGIVRDYFRRLWYDAGNFEEAYRRQINTHSGKERLAMVKWLNNVSEHAPIYYSELVLTDWGSVADKAEEWDKQYPRYPGLQWALARARKSFGNTDRAIEHYERYLENVQDARGYLGLAEAWYMKDHESDEWLDVLENVMDCEDYFLTQSRACWQAAGTLMRDGRFEDALPWAEQAAGSGATLGQLALVDALTGVGEFERAEQVVRQSSLRYQSDAWYEWCVATGEGDLEAAWELKQDQLTRHQAPGSVLWELADALHAMATDENTLALDVFSRIAENRSHDDGFYSWVDAMAYLIADREGDQKTCTQIRQAYQQWDAESEEQSPMTELLSLFAEANREEAIAREKIQKLVHSFGPGWQTAIPMFAGYFEWTHGHADEAIENWLVPARDTSSRNRMLSWKWLREAGVNPINVEGRIFREAFLREPHKLPDQKQ